MSLRCFFPRSSSSSSSSLFSSLTTPSFSSFSSCSSFSCSSSLSSSSLQSHNNNRHNINKNNDHNHNHSRCHQILVRLFSSSSVALVFAPSPSHSLSLSLSLSLSSHRRHFSLTTNNNKSHSNNNNSKSKTNINSNTKKNIKNNISSRTNKSISVQRVSSANTQKINDFKIHVNDPAIAAAVDFADTSSASLSISSNRQYNDPVLKLYKKNTEEEEEEEEEEDVSTSSSSSSPPPAFSSSSTLHYGRAVRLSALIESACSRILSSHSRYIQENVRLMLIDQLPQRTTTEQMKQVDLRAVGFIVRAVNMSNDLRHATVLYTIDDFEVNGRGRGCSAAFKHRIHEERMMKEALRAKLKNKGEGTVAKGGGGGGGEGRVQDDEEIEGVDFVTLNEHGIPRTWTDEDIKVAVSNTLRSCLGRIRNEICSQVDIKYIPEVKFKYDINYLLEVRRHAAFVKVADELEDIKKQN